MLDSFSDSQNRETISWTYDETNIVPKSCSIPARKTWVYTLTVDLKNGGVCLSMREKTDEITPLIESGAKAEKREPNW